MITSKECFDRYGPPEKESSMVVWTVPAALEVGVVPKRIYCNKDLVLPLTKAFTNLVGRGYLNELKTWDGCFNIRKKKGGVSSSLHSWGLAIDVNAAWNGFNRKPMLSPGFVSCFVNSGFDWGGYWSTPDGMHFQLSEFPVVYKRVDTTA